MLPDIMQYVYGALWLIVAALLIFRFAKESKWFYLAGAWFTIFGVITVVNQLMEGKLLVGIWRWIFQIITGIVAIALIFVFLTEGRRIKKKGAASDGGAEQEDVPAYDDQPDYNAPSKGEPYDAPSYDSDPYNPNADL